mgnify:CR=1 FL=1
MTSYNAPFEIHVHGEVLLRDDVDFKALQEAAGQRADIKY